jgi:hypothetical protein
MTLSAGAQFNVQTYIVGALAELAGVGSASQALNVGTLEQFAGGSGVGQADTFFEYAIALAPSASATLALNGGGLLDPFGSAIALVHVKGILITTTASINGVTAGGVILAPGATNPANLMLTGTTPTLTVAAGETLLQTNGNGAAPNLGWPVVASTGMNIKLTNASATVSAFGQMYIWGTST